MRKEAEQLALVGATPDEIDESAGVLINKYTDSLGKIAKPITLDEVHTLIRLFPLTALYGIEWILLHLIESVYSGTEFIKYKELTNECNSAEFRETLVQRLNNS